MPEPKPALLRTDSSEVDELDATESDSLAALEERIRRIVELVGSARAERDRAIKERDAILRPLQRSTARSRQRSRLRRSSHRNGIASSISAEPPAEISFAEISADPAIFRAITPAATKPHVILPEKCPLPRKSEKPECFTCETKSASARDVEPA